MSKVETSYFDTLIQHNTHYALHTICECCYVLSSYLLILYAGYTSQCTPVALYRVRTLSSWLPSPVGVTADGVAAVLSDSMFDTGHILPHRLQQSSRVSNAVKLVCDGERDRQKSSTAGEHRVGTAASRTATALVARCMAQHTRNELWWF